MNKFTASLALCLLALFGTVLAAPSVSKINLKLQKTLLSKTRVNILVSMFGGTESVFNNLVRSRSTFSNRGDQATHLFNALSANAAVSQKSVLQMLTSRRFIAIKVESFWITNQIYIQGADQYLVESLANMEEVSSIKEEQIIHLDQQQVATVNEFNKTAEWGIDIIRAQEAWVVSGNGSGAVVGIIDTGARYTHEAIRESYRGGSHSWYNPYSQTQNPTDSQGHGTHVTGTVAGSLHGIGVAPGAKWISCKGFDDNGFATDAGLIACGQFMACPHTYNGGSPNCYLTPHVVCNSWGGGAGQNWYDAVIHSWHAANIIPIFANGNSGSSCSTSNSPADSEAGVIAVGATTINDSIGTLSSRGPSSFKTLKPDISAPGINIRSASHLNDHAYIMDSGTSMACPHVAGLVGLLKAHNPNLNYATVKSILLSTADRNLSFGSQTCSGIHESEFPNYTFGFGRINALAAVQAIQKDETNN